MLACVVNGVGVSVLGALSGILQSLSSRVGIGLWHDWTELDEFVECMCDEVYGTSLQELRWRDGGGKRSEG